MLGLLWFVHTTTLTLILFLVRDSHLSTSYVFNRKSVIVLVARYGNELQYVSSI